jgi:phosphoribosylglycinamide formyltransferase-1
VTRPIHLGILVSGEGSTLEALAEMEAGEHLPARIALVVSDRPLAPAIEKARVRALPTLVLPAEGDPDDAWAARLTAALEGRGVELVILAGFLTILPPSWVDHWKGRAINLHPSLLPRYGGPGMYGRRVHEAVLAGHERTTGATVHLVTNHVDGGPPIAQERIPVVPDDTPETLRARLAPVEVALLARVIRRFAEGVLPLPYVVSDAGAPRRPGERDARG